MGQSPNRNHRWQCQPIWCHMRLSRHHRPSIRWNYEMQHQLWWWIAEYLFPSIAASCQQARKLLKRLAYQTRTNRLIISTCSIRRWAISVLVGAMMQYLEIGTLRSIITVDVAFRILFCIQVSDRIRKFIGFVSSLHIDFNYAIYCGSIRLPFLVRMEKYRHSILNFSKTLGTLAGKRGLWMGGRIQNRGIQHCDV